MMAVSFGMSRSRGGDATHATLRCQGESGLCRMRAALERAGAACTSCTCATTPRRCEKVPSSAQRQPPSEELLHDGCEPGPVVRVARLAHHLGLGRVGMD